MNEEIKEVKKVKKVKEQIKYKRALHFYLTRERIKGDSKFYPGTAHFQKVRIGHVYVGLRDNGIISIAMSMITDNEFLTKETKFKKDKARQISMGRLFKKDCKKRFDLKFDPNALYLVDPIPQLKTIAEHMILHHKGNNSINFNSVDWDHYNILMHKMIDLLMDEKPVESKVG